VQLKKTFSLRPNRTKFIVVVRKKTFTKKISRKKYEGNFTMIDLKFYYSNVVTIMWMEDSTIAKLL
jgi:hypothetical protein